MGKIVKFMKDWNNQSSYAKWLMQYTKPYIPALTLLMLFSVGSSIIGVYMSVIGKNIIDAATSGEKIVGLIALYVAIILLVQIGSAGSSLMTVYVNEKFSFGVRKQVYDKIIKSCWDKISKYHTGDLMTRLTSDTGTIADGIATVIPQIITLLIELVVTFFTLFYYEPFLAVFALCLAPVAGIFSTWFGKKLKRLQMKVQESESAYRSFITESLSNILVLKAFCGEEDAANRLTELRDQRFHWVFKKAKLSLGVSTSMGLAFQCGYLVAFAWGAIGLSLKTITYGTMSVFLTLINRIQAPIIQLANMVPKLVSILASAGRVMELQNLPVEKRLEEHITPENVGVEISGLSFAYGKEKILDDADLQIRPGEFVAIVGESGIGKTTLVRLMMSFLESPQGLIEFYNQKGETEIANGGSREFISYVPQGNTLFSGTIAHNVRMGKRNATDEEVIEALKAACAYDFVKDMPQGINTVIGEKGHGLSEGQAQRISIARAIIHAAPFMVLDEATSALDEKTELAVLESIRKLHPNPTCLLITHRRSVLNYCDREIRIDDKKTYIRELHTA